MIHYNESAIKFYQKNNFERLRTLLDFYKIDGSYHTAFLYILYLHGQKPPVFGRLLASMRLMISVPSFFFFFVLMWSLLYFFLVALHLEVHSDGLLRMLLNFCQAHLLAHVE